MTSPSLIQNPVDTQLLGLDAQSATQPSNQPAGVQPEATHTSRLPRSNVLIVSPYIFGVGGVAVAISCISRELVSRGLGVVHLTRGREFFIKRLRQETSHATYTVYFRHPIPTLKSHATFWLLLPVSSVNTAHFLIRHKIDHVFVQYPMPAHVILALACRLLGIKLCVTFQGSDAHHLQSLRSDEASHLKWVLRLSHAVTAVSETLAEKVTTFFPALDKKGITVIPNGTPLSVSSVERPACQARKLRVTAVGRLIHRKGFDVLIRAIALLKAHAGTFDCQIIGEGPELQSLEKLAAELGVESMLTFAGSMDHAAVLSQLRVSDIFVLSSRAEGAALVLAEAMSSGCAVISTAVDGALEAITPGENGLLVSVDSPEELASAMRELLVEHSLRQRLAAGGLASSRELLWSRITERYLQVMQDEQRTRGQPAPTCQRPRNSPLNESAGTR